MAYYRELYKKGRGVLHEEIWKHCRHGKTNWTADVLESNAHLLNAYEPRPAPVLADPTRPPEAGGAPLPSLEVQVEELKKYEIGQAIEFTIGKTDYAYQGRAIALLKDGELYIDSIDVPPDYQGAGNAARLMESIKQYAKEKECQVQS